MHAVFSGEKPKKDLMGRFICRWENNIKMELKKYWWEDAD
jgi:hypothetical protein